MNARVADGITVQDVSGKLVYANDAAARFVGFGTAAEFMATPILEVLARFEALEAAASSTSVAGVS